jgi:hypothetical protein
MAECYLLSVCQASALDQYSSRWTLFGLIEALKIEAEAPPTLENAVMLPAEVHGYWCFDQEEVNTDFEWRLVTCTSEGDIPHPRVFAVKASKRRVRHRINGLAIIAQGQTTMFAEWRKQGENDWTRASASWPLDVEFKPVEPSQQAGLPGSS